MVHRNRFHAALLGMAVASLWATPLRADHGSRWTLDGDLRDSAGEHHGTASSAARGATFTQGVDGSPRSAVQLDGRSDFVRFAAAEDLPIFSSGGGYSIAFWVRGAPQNDAVVFAETSSQHHLARFSIGPDSSGSSGRVEVSVLDNSGEALLDGALSEGVAFDGEWHHLAWVNDGGIGTLFIDGVADPTVFDARRASRLSFSFDTTAIGAALTGAAATRFYQGAIDDGGVFTHVLSRLEVLDLSTLFFPIPPDTVEIDGFVVSSVEYDSYRYSFLDQRFTNAVGRGLVSLTCDGATVDGIPVDLVDASILASAVFETPPVVTGQASARRTGSDPSAASFDVEGLTLHYDTVVLTPDGSTASIRVELASNVTDLATCMPAVIDAGEQEIDSENACEFLDIDVEAEFGPWVIGDTGLVVSGVGLVIDFHRTESYRIAPRGWRGLILIAGETPDAPAVPPVSNSGYLAAKYEFSPGSVRAEGFGATLHLAAPFSFRSFEPLGYDIELEAGRLHVHESSISGGNFENGQVHLPALAVTEPGGGRVTASYLRLRVEDDCDLRGAVSIDASLAWGELTGTATPLQPYRIVKGARVWEGHLYLAATHRQPFLPLDVVGEFDEPGWTGSSDPAIPGVLESRGIQGATIVFPPPPTVTGPATFEIHTPDTPTAGSPLAFEFPASFGPRTSWLNFASHGVHGVLRVGELDVQLGDSGGPWYVEDLNGMKPPFEGRMLIEDNEPALMVSFVDSAVFRSSGNVKITLGGPVGATLTAREVAFTSTAHLPGAKIDISNSVQLGYWRVRLAQRPQASTAGVVAFKTGQIFLSAAGFHEERHFDQPFWLIWGEIFSSGDFGELTFDYDSTGQRFDSIPYVPEVVFLSPYDSGNPDSTNSYVQVAGSIFFDFFGPSYLNIIDRYTDNESAPFDHRLVELGDTAVPAIGVRPSDDRLEADWSDLAGFDLHLLYDDGDQDGFRGEGAPGTDYQGLELSLVDGAMTASANLDSERLCFSVSESDSRDFSLGPVAHLGTMGTISGCGCIIDGQLERILVTAELERSAHALLTVSIAQYASIEWVLTPATKRTEVHGSLFANLATAVDLELTGNVVLLTNRDNGALEGEIDANIALRSSLPGAPSVGAVGKLNWHVGPDANWMQGAMKVGVASPLSGAVDGRFFAGLNAPKDELWIFFVDDPRSSLDLSPLPDRLSGVYGFTRVSASIKTWVLSGGVSVAAGAGVFLGDGFPLQVLGHAGVRVWGKILGGLVSASAWGNLQLIVPPGHFRGTVGAEGCVLLACYSTTLSVTLSPDNGISID